MIGRARPGETETEFLVHTGSNPDAVNRPDAVRTIDWMESGRCPENRSCNFYFIGAELES